ncbi:basic helix-loop-helix transcription factor [Suhomyces tanzawaensis NRRL Y-17324]|uniref:Basic helix-loop-helix transcription factor n=1 Tax=Suhomyces tanzawaensis NRRL Y-17324 TaxID=984487 RepID=A0A1E4SCN9_9ASCO|nr:basic helix-loop-helix transcription factor [Suhomyces tanzawaensis NRRL Y-17324]ODV77269.1 basic helix-loop-helix transcription factor [Suhomyces tanzawaensis NRRL Y-17324]
MSDDEKKKRSVKASGLTEEQKKAHHIASEQKRRENIRSEFDKIVSLTPTLNELENRSELNILTKSADFIDHLKEENRKLVELCRANHIEVPQDLYYTGPASDGSDVTK